VTAPLNTASSAEGIVNYDGYQAAVARSGDTVASVAQRIGLSASELGSYNGLSPTHPLRPGDELVLPPKPGGYSSAPAPTTVPQQSFKLPQTNPGIAVADPATTPIEAAPLQSSADPAATAGPVATTAPGASGGAAWSPDLAAAAIDRAAGFDEQGNLAAPPSAEEPLPADPQEPVELASPQLRQYQTPSPQPLTPAPTARPIETIMTPAEEVVEDNSTIEQAATAPEPPVELRLIRPVVGPVVIGFNKGAGQAQNDGIDFASPANAPVVAAAAGEIALVSQSLGGLGNIVLVRHRGDYLTVYGRIEKVKVRKGDIVSQGQKIGVVSPSTNPRMHFEVRQGADSLDPEKFF
jgi:murein DD-endopeptidase MepM/ murein hydrolase activator NlpD